jgi:hypothetical protein
MLKNKYILLTLVLSVSGVIHSASAADADVVREARDRAEIQKLEWNYVRALDSFNSDAYAAVFTEDGQFGTRENAVKGRRALKEMVDGFRKNREEQAAKGEVVQPMNHMITNEYIEFIDKDHARYHCYWMTVFGAVGQDTPPRVAASGRGVDELVRVNGKWLIKSRDVAPQD